MRKAVKDDSSLGLGSGWLTETSVMGGVIKLRLRPNPNFQPPADGPQILIGAGTGIAGLRAHLLYRQKHQLGEAWLLFGERSRANDLYYGEELDALARDGTLTRTDLVFSRDVAPKRYVREFWWRKRETRSRAGWSAALRSWSAAVWRWRRGFRTRCSLFWAKKNWKR